jgi:uncharacterized membrane protein (UPF0127 family)
MPVEQTIPPPPIRVDDGVDGRFAGLPRRALAGELVLIAAATHRSRRRGLARLDRLAADHALHITQTPSVHTVGMRFDLDLIWLGRNGQVVRVDRAVPRGRMRFCLRARSVIETVAGQADAFLAAGAPAAAR